MNTDDGQAFFGDWILYYPREAWQWYTTLSASDWQQLPKAGGWEDQDEVLVLDICTLSRMSGLVRAQMDANDNG